ncbi:hypothetical protein GJ629_00535 [Halapricum sp. CBA1109]|uniref:hypothetical protein n=1 Tax=Halapricum sp. CBA1109 TaxID=2668068 RepID=UPI0012F9D6CE|nr:hypothetical protein [Halapricum sp. CBA1109]MUV88556.1 hypothetical protein [Halapricum sp. CBA1109]
MFTANIVDTVVFRSLGKHPNPHLDRPEDAVEQAQTEIWVPELIYEELADHGPDGTTNPYLDHGIDDEWIRVVSLPDSERNSADGESDPATEAWQEANHFLDQHSKYPTTNNRRDAAIVALAVRLFEQNTRIRVITHTADELLARACAIIPPEFGYHEVASRYYHPPATAKEQFLTIASLTWEK